MPPKLKIRPLDVGEFLLKTPEAFGWRRRWSDLRHWLQQQNFSRYTNHPKVRRVIEILDLEGPNAETEFLPAALEVVETPPSPASRAIGGVIILFSVIAILWASFGSVDIIATAPGKIVPTGRTKVIQPLESGVVRAIHVQDGQQVKAGDVLIEVDTTISAAERDRLKNDFMQAALNMARLKASLQIDNDPLPLFIPPEGATDSEISLQKTLLSNQVDEIRAKLAGLDRQIAKNKGNRDAVAATITKLNESIPYLEKRAAARDYLAERGYGSKLDFLTAQQDLVEHQQELKVQQGRLAEAEGAVAALKEQRRQAEDEYKRTNLKDLSEVEAKAASLQEQFVEAVEKNRLQTLTSPVDGSVQQLAVHTEGGVVTPAQILMSIVPADSRPEIEALVSNKDIGFVRPGQDAAIKIDTFNFTRYGLLHGRVLTVSSDAILRDKPSERSGEKQEPGAENDTSEPKGHELIYAARVSLDQTEMQVDERPVKLTPGMAVTVEIKTGSRHVIDYLLSPIKRHATQALRER